MAHLITNIDHFLDTPGIVAVLVQSGTTVGRGPDVWQAFLARLLPVMPAVDQLLADLGDKRSRGGALRLHLEGFSLHLASFGLERLALAYETGHPIGKSLPRFLNRLAEKPRERRTRVRTEQAGPTERSSNES